MKFIHIHTTTPNKTAVLLIDPAMNKAVILTSFDHDESDSEKDKSVKEAKEYAFSVADIMDVNIMHGEEVYDIRAIRESLQPVHLV